MIYAVVSGENVVVNRLVGEGDRPVVEGCTVVEAAGNDAHIGWMYDPASSTFISPTPVESEALPEA